MGKCFSCFHVSTSESLPDLNDSFVEGNHSQSYQQAISNELNNHTKDNISSNNHSTAKKSTLSNGTTVDHYNKQTSESTTSATTMQHRSERVTRSSLQSKLRSSFEKHTQSGNSTNVSENKINTLFDHYKDKDCIDEDCILAEGIERLCKDLAVSPDDVKILVLAWKLDAQQMCRFTRTEFVNGLKLINVDSIKGIQTKLPDLVNKVRESNDEFKSLYRFTFKFGLDANSGQRILPVDMAIILWRLVFSIKYCDSESYIINAWINFLNKHSNVVRGIPRDTWNMFLNFNDTIGDDLSKYDDTEAWPSIFDDFVEYQNDQTNQNTLYDNKKENNMDLNNYDNVQHV